MKLNRKTLFLIIGIVVVFIALFGFLYSANSGQKKQERELTSSITQNQAILNKGMAEKAAKEKEATELNNELAAVQAEVKQIDFRASAESIEYDRILYAIADQINLQITRLAASAPADAIENDTSYQITTFNIDMEGKTPETLFNSTGDSVTYNDDTVNKILEYINKISSGDDLILPR